MDEENEKIYKGVPIDQIPTKLTPDAEDKFVIETTQGTRTSKWENVLKQVTGGWNIVAEEIEDGERVVKRVTGFVGGVPPLPQALADLVGLYYSGSGGFTADISLATDYKGNAGNDGADGKTTEQWTAKPFVAGSTVYYGGNSIWEANADTLDTDVPDVSPKWELRITANETIESTEVAAVVDAVGSMVAEWDKDGKFKTRYQDRSIPNEALESEVKFFFDRTEIIEDNEWVEVQTDEAGNILKGLRKDGTFYFNKIESENYTGNIATTVGEDQAITDATYLTFDFPDSVVDIDVQGALPTDISPARATTDVVLTFSKGGQFLFKCKAEMAIQGQNSVNYPKKGYEADFLNSKGETLLIKWGNMHAVDAINFKAFYSDPTMTKDLSAGRLWHKIRTSRPFPSSFIADLTSDITSSNKRFMYYDDALFYPDGFPMRMTANKNYHGLYVWRMKKKRENYRMDSANLNNIFLDSAINTGISFTAFDPTHWDLKSPKLSGYNEGGPVNNSTVLASINRVFDWAGKCVAGTVDMRTTYQDYLNLDSVIDYIIASEIICNRDAAANNTEFMTWDGLHWSYCIYDLDHTAGYIGTSGFMAFEMEGLIGPWWEKLKTVFHAELSARYAELREAGIITLDSIYEIYSEIPKTIPTDYYVENLAKWGWLGQELGNLSLRQIMTWFTGRLNHLDAFYNYN